MPGFSLRNPHAVIVGALLAVILGITAFCANARGCVPTDWTFPSRWSRLSIRGCRRSKWSRTSRPDSSASSRSAAISSTWNRALCPALASSKCFFSRGSILSAAASTLGNLAMADLRHLPPGTLPPLILKSGASALPVTLVTVSGEGFDEAQLRDEAQYNIRNWLATVPRHLDTAAVRRKISANHGVPESRRVAGARAHFDGRGSRAQ